MGFISKIVKGVKNIFKGAAKVFKRAVKAVKQFVTSDLGKVILASAAIYFGGVALGAWGTGTTVAAPVAEVASAAGTAAPAATTAIPSGLGVEGLGAATAVTDAAATAAPAAGLAQAATQAPGAFETIKGVATGAMDKLSAGAKAYEAWAKANPLTSKVVGKALVSLTASPDPNQQLEVEKWRRAQMNVAGVDPTGAGVGSLNLPQLQRTTRYVDPLQQQQQGGLVSRIQGRA